jgi:hypothetical protein
LLQGSSPNLHPYCGARNPVLHGEKHVVACGSQFGVRRRRRVHRERVPCRNGVRHLELQQPLPHGVRVRHERRTLHVQFEASLPLRGCERDRERVAVADRAGRVGYRRPDVVVSANRGTEEIIRVTGYQNQSCVSPILFSNTLFCDFSTFELKNSVQVRKRKLENREATAKFPDYGTKREQDNFNPFFL